MIAIIEYEEVRPCRALAPYVDCYRVLRTEMKDHPTSPALVLPTGSTDIFFNFGELADPPGGLTSKSSTPQSYVAGPIRQAFEAKLGRNMDLVGIRFKPGAAAIFLHTAVDELTALEAEVQSVLGLEGVEIEARLSAPGIGQRLAHLERFLMRRLERGYGLDADVSRAISLIERSRGNLTMLSLREELGVGERRLQRRFKEHVGLTPKGYARIVRLRYAAALLDQRPDADPLELVHSVGFYDQAHFIHEFKAGTGLSPGAYARARRDRGDGFLQFNTPDP